MVNKQHEFQNNLTKPITVNVKYLLFNEILNVKIQSKQNYYYKLILHRKIIAKHTFFKLEKFVMKLGLNINMICLSIFQGQ